METRLKLGEISRLRLDRGRRDRRAQQLSGQARKAGLPVEMVTTADLDRQFPQLHHQGVAGEVLASTPSARWQDCIAGKDLPLVLVLDGVEDPRNLGACLRSADGAGADCVVIPKRRAAGLTAVARKTAAGAAERLPLQVVPNLARTLEEMRAAGLWVIGLADADDARLFDADLNRPLALVLGNEGQGLRRLVQAQCDAVLSLPMAGAVSSLNVSVATGIALYEAVRQRG